MRRRLNVKIGSGPRTYSGRLLAPLEIGEEIEVVVTGTKLEDSGVVVSIENTVYGVRFRLGNPDAVELLDLACRRR
jgi:hypothetical protein